MPKPKDPDGGREGRNERERREREEHTHQGHERHEGGDERHGDKDEDRPRRRRMGREHAVHQQIVERRLSGGAPATPAAYANALEQWKQLPGSIVRPPTDEKPINNPSPEIKDENA
jgi:hypothetical protein